MCNGLFTLPDPDPGMDIYIPKIGTLMIGDLDPDWNQSSSMCNGNSFCTVQCSH